MIAWVQRRGVAVLACGIACGIFAFVIASLLPDRYKAESVVVVPSGSKGGLSPGEASNLATTYANLIPEDREVLARTATRLGLTPLMVRDSLTVTHDFDTSILRVFFSHQDPSVAVRGARFLAEAIAGPKPASPRIAPGTLSIVARPVEAETDRLDPFQAIALGVILGLAGGAILVLAWDRADARIRDSEALSAEAGCAASSLIDASDDSLVALLDRWADIAGSSPLRIALLAATPGAEIGAERGADRLLRVARSHPNVMQRHSTSASTPRIAIDVGGAVGGPAAGERLARSANLVVLVVAQETPVTVVHRSIQLLEHFDARPDWAVLVENRDLAEERVLTMRGRESAGDQPPRSQSELAPIRSDPLAGPSRRT